MTEGSLRLVDGRTLAWREFGDPEGDPEGVPVVAVHGSPDSSAIWGVLDDAAQQLDVRVVAPDRPGFGASTPKPGRLIIDRVSDLDELIEHLQLGNYRLLAIGGAYALAVAWTHPAPNTSPTPTSCSSPTTRPSTSSTTSTRSSPFCSKDRCDGPLTACSRSPSRRL